MALVLSVTSGSIAALSVFLVSIAMAGALAYRSGPVPRGRCRWRWPAARWA
ncbi:MAG: hypothetical protein WAK82_26415 [Streptosporangiaceae bacterium]